MSTPARPTVIRPQNGAGPEAGTWRAYRAEAAPHRTVVRVRCPYCSGVISLRSHSISAEGLVQPCVDCPRGCGFSGYVRLEQFGAKEVSSCA